MRALTVSLALTLTFPLMLRQFGEAFRDAGFMTTSSLLFYRADRALD
jgi:hypothetical protein